MLSQTWNLSAPVWHEDTANGPTTNWVNGIQYNAVIKGAAGAMTITVGTDVQAGTITFGAGDRTRSIFP